MRTVAAGERRVVICTVVQTSVLGATVAKVWNNNTGFCSSINAYADWFAGNGVERECAYPNTFGEQCELLGICNDPMCGKQYSHIPLELLITRSSNAIVCLLN